MRGKIVTGAVVLFVVLLIIFAATGGEKPAVVEPAPTEASTEAATESMPASMMLDVAYLSQNDGYPTGCESISAVMALNNAGVEIVPNEFIDDYLPMGDNPSYDYEYESYIGDSPDECFLGNPYSDSGLGCYAPVIAKTINSVIKDRAASSGLSAVDAHDGTLDDLCAQYVVKGTPVIVWATMEMKEAEDDLTWITDNGDEYTWKSPEHCLVLVGCDASNYYFNDPQKGKDTAYPKDKCEKAFESLGRQSVVIVK